jgi:hypothetical protein
MKAMHYHRMLLTGLSIMLLSVGVFGRQHKDQKTDGGRYEGMDTVYNDTNGMPDTLDGMNGMRDTARGTMDKEFFEANGYDTSETLSVTGTVDSVDTTDEVVILSMRTEEGRLDVHTAPQWYLREQGLSFSEGDSLQVTGRPRALNGKTALVADEVKVFTNAMQLRKEGGTPLWSKPRTGLWDAFRRKR